MQFLSIYKFIPDTKTWHMQSKKLDSGQKVTLALSTYSLVGHSSLTTLLQEKQIKMA